MLGAERGREARESLARRLQEFPGPMTTEEFETEFESFPIDGAPRLSHIQCARERKSDATTPSTRS